MYGDREIYRCPDDTAVGSCAENGTRGDLREHLVRDHRRDAETAESLAYAELEETS